jgi:hypothetical protein|tara:strand:+ start:4481 stop:6013 length:1533 start_codon:yes stop_codon:yes gene_type:complete
MDDLNKITHTRIGDNIHYYINGNEGRGTVVKMNNAYLSVLKEGGSVDEIHINDTFFVKDILTNKTWNDMSMEERTLELNKARAYSPMFLSKTWEDLPKELKDVIVKSNLEESTHGQIGGNRAGVSTKIPFDADEDYEGESDDDKKEEFKHEKEKPTVDKNNGIEESHKDEDAMQEDWRKTGGKDDKNKTYINKYGQGGNKFVNNPSVGGGETMASSIEATSGAGKPRAKPTKDTKYFDDKGKPITAEAHQAAGGVIKTWQLWLEKKKYDYVAAEENQKEIFAKRDKKREADKKVYGTLGSVPPPKKQKVLKAWELWLNKFTGGDLGNKPENTTIKEPKSTLQRGRGNRATTPELYTDDQPTAADLKANLQSFLPKDYEGQMSSKYEQDQKRIQERGRNHRERERKHGEKVRQNIRDRADRQTPRSRVLGDEPSRKQGQLQDPKESGRTNQDPKRPKRDTVGSNQHGSTSFKFKEGDGAGNSGVTSTETAGVYNPRYSDSKGRYRDQEKDE